MASACHHNLQVNFEKCFRLGAGSKIVRLKTGEALVVDPGLPETWWVSSGLSAKEMNAKDPEGLNYTM
eukprot:9776287-Karenia_brevis.AAC.1